MALKKNLGSAALHLSCLLNISSLTLENSGTEIIKNPAYFESGAL